MEPTATSGPDRRLAWSGVAFAVLYVAGMSTAAGPGPEDVEDLGDQPAKLAAAWRDFYADSGNRTTIIIGTFIIALAALAMVVFGAHLRDRLADAGAGTSGRLAFAGSIIFATFTILGGVAMAWIPGSKSFGTVALPSGEINYLAPQLGYAMLLIGGGAGAALMLVAAGRGFARTGALPAWLGWAGIVIGVLLFFFAVLFLPMTLLVIWVLVAAIVSLRKPALA